MGVQAHDGSDAGHLERGVLLREEVVEALAQVFAKAEINCVFSIPAIDRQTSPQQRVIAACRQLRRYVQFERGIGGGRDIGPILRPCCYTQLNPCCRRVLIGYGVYGLFEAK